MKDHLNRDDNRPHASPPLFVHDFLGLGCLNLLSPAQSTALCRLLFCRPCEVILRGTHILQRLCLVETSMRNKPNPRPTRCSPAFTIPAPPPPAVDYTHVMHVSAASTVHPDVILRSCDGKDFVVHKLDLLRSSPIFGAALAIVQPSTCATLGNLSQHHQLPVVNLTDTSEVLELLLWYLSPGPSPPIIDMRTATRVLDCARKYQLQDMEHAACISLGQLASDEPVRVYAIACHYGLEPQARTAAQACLRLPLAHTTGSRVEELQSISGEEFRRLVRYRETCRDAVVNCPYLTRNVNISPHHLPVVPGTERHSLWACRCAERSGPPPSLRPLPKWWREFTHALTLTLQDDTSPEAIDTQHAVEAFLRSGACQACREVAASQIFQTVAQLRVEISRVIQQVTLEFEPFSGQRPLVQYTGVVGPWRRLAGSFVRHVGSLPLGQALFALLVFLLGMLVQRVVTAPLDTRTRTLGRLPTQTMPAPATVARR